VRWLTAPCTCLLLLSLSASAQAATREKTDHKVGVEFKLAGHTLRAKVVPPSYPVAGTGVKAELWRHHVRAACATSLRRTVALTVHTARRWPRGRLSLKYRFQRDISARARYCLLEDTSGGDLALVYFPLPRVAQVGREPITRRVFMHWLRIVDSSNRKKATCKLPQKSSQRYAAGRDNVMRFLISAHWLRGEAAERRIRASAREVRVQRDETKNLAFGSEKQYRRFLRETCQTERDIDFRVKNDMLQRRIRRQVVAGKTGPAREQAITQFLTAFNAKWKARTVCMPGFVIAECSNTG
jgi:hypothetical protein